MSKFLCLVLCKLQIEDFYLQLVVMTILIILTDSAEEAKCALSQSLHGMDWETKLKHIYSILQYVYISFTYWLQTCKRIASIFTQHTVPFPKPNVFFSLIKEYNFMHAIYFFTIVNKTLLPSGFREIFQWRNLDREVTSKPFITLWLAKHNVL